MKLGDQVNTTILINSTFSNGTDPKWSDNIFTVKGVEGQRIRLSDGFYYLDENLLKVPSTATDAETNVIKKVTAIQQKQHRHQPTPKLKQIQPNPFDEHIREMAKQAGEESQQIVKRQQTSFVFFESRKRKNIEI